jgi:hypothetical protein
LFVFYIWAIEIVPTNGRYEERVSMKLISLCVNVLLLGMSGRICMEARETLLALLDGTARTVKGIRRDGIQTQKKNTLPAPIDGKGGSREMIIVN